MTRRGFFAMLFAAPIAAVAAMRTRIYRPRITSVSLVDGHHTFAPTWSDSRSSPLEDVERAMRKVREAPAYKPTTVTVRLKAADPDLVAEHVSVALQKVLKARLT
jgi:hypothetical protein